MITPQIPVNEEIRQHALDELGILDTITEEEYDNITKIAARIINVPICMISLIDGDRQWFKSKIGLESPETSRETSFCAHAINYNDTFVVNNALEDKRFYDNPLVTGNPNIRFYAGSQLTTEDGLNIGTLCVIDTKPRELSNEDKQLLQVLAKNVITLMEVRKKNKELDRQVKESLLINDELKKLLKNKEESIAQGIDQSKLSESKNTEFDVMKSLVLIKNAILSEYEKQNNKILYPFFSNKIINNQNAFELLMCNLLLLQNQYHEENVIRITFQPIDSKIQVGIKHLYSTNWNKIVKIHNINLQSIQNNPFMKEANKYAEIIRTTITIEKDLQKGLSLLFNI